ncbi:MAG: CoA ester lyase [Chloroflexota bacterium]|nr:CoA ester lyase [Chloroflexota bacterium]MDE3193672.1 CoA ester lyase [Chloroflexota bacterium]
MDIARSLMFVPGHRAKMVDKAGGLGTLDLAMFDIEDGVPPAEKDTARALLGAKLPTMTAARPRRFVRVNAVKSDRFARDVAAVVVPGVEGLALPKVESADEVRDAERDVAERERETGAKGTTFIVAIESAIGLLRAYEIAAASPRVMGLMFGAEDFANDLGLPTDRRGAARELAQARAQIVFAATAAHVQSYDGVWPEIADLDGLRRDSVQSRELGFTGKTLIHPGQIETINAVFTPSDADVDLARKVVAAFEEAVRRGEGAIAFGGQLIDLPIVERARRVIALYEATR